MLFKGPLGGGVASGSIAGMTASRNRGGQYLRNRSVPTNPRTARQTATRNIFALLSSRWGQGIADGSIDETQWSVYAASLTRVNSVGDKINLSASQAFMMVNYPRAFLASLPSPPVGVDILPGAPIDGNDADIGLNFDITQIIAGSAGVKVQFDETKPWAVKEAGACLVYISPGVNPGVSTYHGPYRFAGFVQGDTTPLTPPVNLANVMVNVWGSTPPAGILVFWRAVITDDIGRISQVRFGDFETA